MLTMLVGGPVGGLVTETSGNAPVVLLWTPRELTLFDMIERSAWWNKRCEWYEATPR